MKLKAFGALAVLALATTGVAQAQTAGSGPAKATTGSSAYDGRWYVAPTVGGYYNDTARDTNSRQLYYGIGFGKFINDFTSVDFFVDTTSRRVDYSGNHWKNYNIGLAARFYAGGWNDWRPYALFGAMGSLHNDPGANGWSPAVEAGVGLSKTLNENMDLRMETGVRYDHDYKSLPNPGYTDYFLGLSLVSRFGAAAPPPAPVAPPPPKPVAPPPPPKPSCSELDSDHDGVNNCDDKCPNTPPGTIVGPDGCPQKVVIELRGVHFKFDRPHIGETKIKPTLQDASEGVNLLDQAVDTLKRYKDVRVKVAGYTDSIGTAAYNQALSMRRARIVYNYLVDHGVSPKELEGPVGHGENDPVASNATAEGRSRNRRVELQVQNQ